MELNCEGCAACCMDWRPLLEEFESDGDRERDADRSRHRPFRDGASDGTGGREPLDDDPNFVPLTREEVRGFVDDGMASALTPRFWAARDESDGVEIDGYTLAAVAGRPAFFVGLRKPPKPVAPFGLEERRWLPACVFLDPDTLQCRLHDDERYPAECSAYPAHNLALEQSAECERVESTVDAGTARLLEADVEADPDGLLLGTQAIGEKLFCHPEPDRLAGTIGRIAAGESTPADRAETLAVAAASSPGTLATSAYHYDQAKARVLETGPEDDREDASWVGPAIDEWYRHAARIGGEANDDRGSDLATAVEGRRGAPETPGWGVDEGMDRGRDRNRDRDRDADNLE
ncbi:YkgJ family cysteine cluster protein [Halobiforma nitratireducens]|nr:YkgJ family cysteine cluster protein [Halobiforma nitratireducens]